MAYRETRETHRDGERDRENANFNSNLYDMCGGFCDNQGP